LAAASALPLLIDGGDAAVAQAQRQLRPSRSMRRRRKWRDVALRRAGCRNRAACNAASRDRRTPATPPTGVIGGLPPPTPAGRLLRAARSVCLAIAA